VCGEVLYLTLWQPFEYVDPGQEAVFLSQRCVLNLGAHVHPCLCPYPYLSIQDSTTANDQDEEGADQLR
jgi:hypothetical protein